MVNHTKEENRHSRRREFLKVSGAAVVAAFAGCTSNQSSSGSTPSPSETNPAQSSSGSTPSPSETNSTGSGSTGSTSNETLVSVATTVPANYQWNPYSVSNYPGDGSDMVFDQPVYFNGKSNTIVPYILQDWEKNGDTLIANLRKDDTWHNGDKVTAEDFVTKFKIEKGMGSQITNYINKAIAVDDATIKYSLTEDYRKKVIMRQLSLISLNTPTSRYKKFADRFDKASSDDERQKVQSDVSDYSPKKPLGSGPFKYDSVNQQALKLTKHEKHPDSNKIEFSNYKAVYRSSNQQVWASIKNANETNVSSSTFFPKRILKSLPDYDQEYETPAYTGYGLMFNHNDDDFKKRNVRRALAYIIDQDKLANLADPTKAAVKIPTGAGSYHADNWKEVLGNDVSIYEKYKDRSKAADLLKQEGYTKKGGTWHKPNGDPFKFKLTIPSSWSDFVNLTKTVTQMLTEFGIKAQSNTVERTAFVGQYWEASNFKVIPWFWSSGSIHPLPFSSFSWMLTSNTVMTNMNYVEKPEVPPMGKPNAKAKKTNVRKPLRKLGTSSNKNTRLKLTRQLAWVINQNLPSLPLIEKAAQSVWDGNELNTPPVDADKQYIYIPFSYWPRAGLVTPKQ